MKKIILLLITVFTIQIGNGQEETLNNSIQKFIFPQNLNDNLSEQYIVLDIEGSPSELYNKVEDYVEKTYKNPSKVFLSKRDGEYIRIEGNSKLYDWAGTKHSVFHQIEFQFKQNRIKVSIVDLNNGVYDIDDMCTYKYSHKSNGDEKKTKSKWVRAVLKGLNELMYDMYLGFNDNSKQNDDW
jgi:hypothetical protein|tara:strand:- start:64 stop:612 length:549 start_codon:yes stop_codon:yes gene_type:complete